MTIAFDCDDCLLIPSVATGSDRDIPNYETITIYRWFQSQGNVMIIWSGSGIDYARMWSEKLGLKPNEIRIKEKSEDVDLAFDDCIVDLAKVNIRVKRINNSISRKEWNETKRVEEIYPPMGVSQWLNHGKKYGYDNFFLDKLKDEIISLIENFK